MRSVLHVRNLMAAMILLYELLHHTAKERKYPYRRERYQKMKLNMK
jgi:hypothetical protein